MESTWRKKPQYQKAVQKILSLAPEDQAIVTGLFDVLESRYAAKEMENELKGRRMALTEESRTAELDLKRKAFELDTSEKAWKREREGKAADISKWSIPVGGVMGLAKIIQNKELERDLQDLIKRTKKLTGQIYPLNLNNIVNQASGLTYEPKELF